MYAQASTTDALMRTPRDGLLAEVSRLTAENARLQAARAATGGQHDPL